MIEDISFSSLCETSNTEILNYFSKFSDNSNYEYHYSNLKNLSKFRHKGSIEIGNLKMPNIGPSDDLSTFPETLKDWGEKDIFEIKNIIKLYDTGDIENLEEAVILIEILKTKGEYSDILNKIIDDIKKGSLENIENYQDLLQIKDSEDSIILGGIWRYLISLTS